MKKIKNLKPVDVIADLRYRCPNCAIDHWVSLKESRTSNFLIVCDCDTIIKPKRIKTIIVQYAVDSQNKNLPEKKVEKQNTNQNIIDQANKILKTYGFTSNESIEIIAKYTSEEKYDSVKPLIEKILSNLEKST
jgi:uncharacterized protein YbcC (UPF0753/DUF2309 family)